MIEGGKSASFLYDAEGNRLIRRDSSGTVLHLGAMEVRLAPGATRYYAHGDKPVAVRTNDQRLSWLLSSSGVQTSIRVLRLLLLPHPDLSRSS